VRSNRRARLPSVIALAALSLPLTSIPAAAQWVGYPTAAVPRKPDGKVNMSAPAPKLPDGKPDFSGIWQTTSAADYDLEPHSARRDAPPSAGVVQGDAIPYLPVALAQKRRNFDARLTADPRLKCWTLGTPRGVYYPEPFQVFQRDRDLTLVFQFGHSVRTIHTNGTLHPVETDNEFWLGDSRGHWQGNTLVVETTIFSDQASIEGSSKNMRLTERWTRVADDRLDYRFTVEDADTWTRPWSARMAWNKAGNLYEYACHEDNYGLYGILAGQKH
jgi:hypothetical protein